ILVQRRIPIDPAWDAWTLARRLDRPSLALLRDTVRRYAQGDPPTALPQDEARATAAPSPAEGERAIRWREPAESIARRVRASAPWPGAFTHFGASSEHTIVLTRVDVTRRVPAVLEVGEACVVDGRVVVRTGDGGLVLVRGRLIGEDDVEKELEAE